MNHPHRADANSSVSNETRLPDIKLIGEVAREIGLEPKTIRFYEKVRLVLPRKHGRLRIFYPEHVDRLLAIKKLREYGLSLAKIRTIILVEGGLGLATFSSPTIRSILAEQLAEMNKHHALVTEHITDLQQRLKCDNERLEITI